MNHITVSELIEKLKVADGCARVVLVGGSSKDRVEEFDVRCIAPASEVTIEFLSAHQYDELEADMIALEKKYNALVLDIENLNEKAATA